MEVYLENVKEIAFFFFQGKPKIPETIEELTKIVSLKFKEVPDPYGVLVQSV